MAHEGGLTFSDDPERVCVAQFGLRLRQRFLYEYSGHRFYVMEFIPGETLQAYVERNGPLEMAEALKLTSQVARALEAADERSMGFFA